MICSKAGDLLNKNYIAYHVHSDLSSGVTNIDSVTKYYEYIDYAASLGMKAMAFSEHGSVFQWVKKKTYMEEKGLKYIHAEEFYVTEKLIEETTGKKIRDNKHVVLIAKNKEGVCELNKLSSISFNEEHKYYAPRITIDELINTSKNIIVTTACLGGILFNANDEYRKKFLKFLISNNDRCFLEIQHHKDESQIKYNQYLYKLSNKYSIPLIAGTDTHALNDKHLKGRAILQKAKNIHFSDEDSWDLTFKTYEELVQAYAKQNSLPMDVVLEAINNTNVMADMVEDFELDYSYKYPHLWEEPEKVFMEKIHDGIIRRGVDKYSNYQEYLDRIQTELKAYKHNGAIDFMLLMEDIISWCTDNGIYIGYGRGSCTGSVIAWLLGITEMDSIKHGLNFERFMNVERVSLSDIDTDFPPTRRKDVKDYIYNKTGLYCCDIITFNTIADKGAIRDVIRGMMEAKIPNMPKDIKDDFDNWWNDMLLDGYGGFGAGSFEYPERFKKYILDKSEYMKITNQICEEYDTDPEGTREKYPSVFEYVDIVKGAVVSVGSHPCGTVVSPHDVTGEFGVFYTYTSEYPISQIYMKEIDSLNYVKLDLLALDTIELINETCALAGIERLTPDNVDISDINVWNSIRDDTTQIFQWEGHTGESYIKKLLSDDNIKRFQEVNKKVDRMTLLSIGNSAIRPAGASYRDDLGNGIVRKTGSKPIDDFLKPTFGYLVFQCQIIEFLHKYCGFTMGEADIVRRGFAKKTGTDQYIPIIKDGGYMPKSEHYIDGYITTMKRQYGIAEEKSEKDILAFIQVIEDASSYLFSLNHSQPYSYEGYVSGWLRYYYTVEFITTALNINQDKEEKTIAITEYAKKNGVDIMPIKFRHSQAKYSCDSKEGCVYKGISSIKFLNAKIADELYELGKNKYDSFIDLLIDIKETSVNSKQLSILIKLDFFSEFGEINTVLKQAELFDKIYGKKQFKTDKLEELEIPLYIIMRHAKKQTEKVFKDFDSVLLLKDIIDEYKYEKTSILDKIKYQQEFYGYIQLTVPSVDKSYAYIQSIDGIRKKTALLYRLKNGETEIVRIRQRQFNENPIHVGDIIKTIEASQEKKWKKNKETEEFYQIDEYETILKKWSFVR